MKKPDNDDAPVIDLFAIAAPLSSFVLNGVERLEWEMERIELTLEREGARAEDRNAVARCFNKISRECELLRKWLREAPLEETRN